MSVSGELVSKSSCLREGIGRTITTVVVLLIFPARCSFFCSSSNSTRVSSWPPGISSRSTPATSASS